MKRPALLQNMGELLSNDTLCFYGSKLTLSQISQLTLSSKISEIFAPRVATCISFQLFSITIADQRRGKRIEMLWTLHDQSASHNNQTGSSQSSSP